MNKMKDMIKAHSPLMDMFTISRFDNILNELYQVMNSVWNDTELDNRAFNALQPKANFPKINVAETSETYEVEIAISGFAKDNLQLEFKDSCLYIKADKTEDSKEETKKWLTREISSKSFRRLVRFPSEVDCDAITSKYDEDKALVVCTLPKKDQKRSDTIKIEIK